VEWIAAAIALLAAGAAFWQAWEARRSRRGADESAAEAGAAWTRMADALEAQARRADAEAERYGDPWVVQAKLGKSMRTWDVHLTGDEVLSEIEWDVEPDDERFSSEGRLPTEMAPGQVATFHVLATMGVPRKFELTITWLRPGSEKRYRKIATLQVF